MAHANNWQKLLDYLTLKSKEDGILDQVDNCRTQEELIKFCYTNKFCRKKLSEWITTVIGVGGFIKSSAKSSSFRMLGNEKFRLKDNPGSLKMYTESIRYAPDCTEDLSLALANRSAVLFHTQNFEDCLNDIQLAFEKGYPVPLKYKLYMRQGQCLLKLGRATDAVAAFEKAQSFLENISTMPVSKLNAMYLDAETALNVAVSQIQIEKSKNTSVEEVVCKLPVPSYGENNNFLYASEAIDIRYSDSKGRHVVANKDIKLGDILFVEKPFTFVVLPYQNDLYCHNCCKPCRTPIPCWHCIDCAYCSNACGTEAWQQYHQWECSGGLELMHSVGIAHLGLRVVLKAGPLSKLKGSYAALQEAPPTDGCYGNKEDNYPAVYHLMPHLDNMQVEDIFQYGLTATVLTLFLSEHSDYFKQNIFSNEVSGLRNDYNIDEEILFVGGLILRHIAQLVCNAHAIIKLDTSVPTAESHSVVTESQVRVATAIYPSASMMNHSCDPNIITSFCDQYLIVRASKSMAKGEEIYNCYGPHFRRMSRRDRQYVLQNQYYFTCKCEPCLQVVDFNFEERFCALLCSYCKGPLLENEVAAANRDTHKMVCGDCGTIQPYSQLVESAFKAHELFNEASADLEAGNIKEALKKFEICLKLRQGCLYKSNKDIAACVDQIAKCYAVLGEYDKSVKYLLQSVPAVEEQFGPFSIEVAHELQKLSDVMLCDLQEQTSGSSAFLEKHHNVVECVQKAKDILELYYGTWNIGLQEIIGKQEKLRQMLT